MRLEYLIQNNLMRILESLYFSLIVGNACDQLRIEDSQNIRICIYHSLELFVHCFAVNDINDFSVNIFFFSRNCKEILTTNVYAIWPRFFSIISSPLLLDLFSLCVYKIKYI